jgi:hypothetical protein
MTEATLKIKEVTQDLRDPTGLSFVLHFTRNLTQLEREHVPTLLTMRFLPTEQDGPDTVVIRNASEGWFTLPQHRRTLKAAVADAEKQVENFLSLQHKAEGQAAARAEETRRRLAEIDWDSDSE